MKRHSFMATKIFSILVIVSISVLIFQNCGEAPKAASHYGSEEEASLNDIQSSSSNSNGTQTRSTASNSSNTNNNSSSSTSKSPGKSKLEFLFCDIKRSVAQREGDFDSTNYKQYIDAFKNKLGCNGIRFPIDSKTDPDKVSSTAPNSKPESYTKLYRNAYSYARSQGLLIYANLLPEIGELEYNGKLDKWVDNTVAYVNHFCPDFVGPMNENSGFDNPTLLVKNVGEKIKSTCVDPFGYKIKNIQIIGPDTGVATKAISLLKDHPNFVNFVDVVSSHNNNGGSNYARGGSDASDRSATAADWATLYAKGGKPVWASEGPATWSAIPSSGTNKGKEVGIKAIMASKVVSGIVLYSAEKRINKNTFELTSEGKEVVDGLESYGW